MVVRTKYKKSHLVLELVALGISVLWIVAALVLYYNFVAETEIVRRNFLLLSVIMDVFVETGLSVITVLPAGNALINNKNYREGSAAFKHEKEVRLRRIFLVVKLALLAVVIFIGLADFII